VVAIDLNAAPANLDKVVFVTSIYDSETSGTTFGQVRNAYIRVVNSADNSEMARYDLSEDASVETAMVFGELYRHGAEWKFRAIGQGYSAGCPGSPRTTASTSDLTSEREGTSLWVST